MGERKGQQKYYPPDWRPEHGSLDKFYGTHPLRDRARKLDRGILIIRFEMPFNIWCDGCNNHIGMGVRYNAEKTKVGMYYSTPIYKFSMKCVYCPSIIQIQTDPKNCDYTVMSGARRQNNRWKAEDAEQIEAVEYNEKQRLRNDAMFNLDYGHKDKTKAAKEIPTLAELYHIQSDNWKDCYTANSLLRKKFREEKKQIIATEQAEDEIVDKLNLNFDLVPENELDSIEAKTALNMQSSSSCKSKPTQIGKRRLGVKLTAKSLKLRNIKQSIGFTNSKKTKTKLVYTFKESVFSGLVSKKSKGAKTEVKEEKNSSLNDSNQSNVYASGSHKIGSEVQLDSNQTTPIELRNVNLCTDRTGSGLETNCNNQVDDKSTSSLMSLAGNYSDSDDDS